MEPWWNHRVRRQLCQAVMDRAIWRMRSPRKCILSALSHSLSSNWYDRLRHISSRGKILIFSTGRVPTGHKYWHMCPGVCGEACKLKPLPCHGWKVICWPWRWQVHVRGVWRGLQLRGRGSERGASAFMPVVCFTARPAMAMMKSKAAVWHGKTKQPNPAGKSQNGRRLLLCVGKDSATE